jgi:hypothetical protein
MVCFLKANACSNLKRVSYLAENLSAHLQARLLIDPMLFQRTWLSPLLRRLRAR